jgi:hypothetical protein
MSTRVLSIVLGLFFLALGVGSVLRARQFWSGDPKYRERQAWWSGSEETWLALHRTVVFGAVFGCLGIPLMALFGAIWPPPDHLEHAPRWFAIAGLVTLAVSLLGMFSTAVFARPKCLIPPMLREDPSLVTVWFRTLTGRHRQT